MKKIRKALAIILSLVLLISILPAINGGSSAKAAAGFAITAPAENALVAAGYFDIKWSAVEGKVSVYEVYFDDTLQGTTKNTMFECYSTKVAMHSAYVVAKLTDGSKQTSDKVWFGISKKGLGLGKDMGENISLKDMKVSWYYNWGTDPSQGNQYKGIEFVPMQWGSQWSTYAEINDRVNNWAANGYKYALAFNEPDLNGQGVTSVENAAKLWPAFMGRNIRIGSPASFLWPAISNWLKDFMVKIDNNVDFITIHCYPEDNPGGKSMADWFLKDVVDSAWEIYHKPIWITEFSTVDKSEDRTNVTAEGTAEFWKYVMQGLDEREYVERYAAFCFNTADGPKPNDKGQPGAGLWNYFTGELSLGGQVYRDYGNPEGYVSVEPDYKTKMSVRTALLEDNVIINNISCEDYVNQPGVSATATTQKDKNSGADMAIDGDIKSRWESKQGIDPQSLTVDLGQVRNIKQVSIIWEQAGAKTYTIDVSADGKTWTQSALVEGGTYTQNRLDTTTFKNMTQARYVRINGTARTSTYGYSIFDVAIYGTTNNKVDETTEPPTTKPRPTTAPVPTTVKPTTQPIVTQPETTTEMIGETTQNKGENPSQTTVGVQEESPAISVDKIGKTSVKKATKKIDSIKVKVSLKKIKKVKGYQIRIYKSRKAKKAFVKRNVKKARFTIKSKKFKNRKKLYVKARAYKIVKGHKYYGKWTKKKKIHIKK